MVDSSPYGGYRAPLARTIHHNVASTSGLCFLTQLSGTIPYPRRHCGVVSLVIDPPRAGHIYP